MLTIHTRHLTDRGDNWAVMLVSIYFVATCPSLNLPIIRFYLRFHLAQIRRLEEHLVRGWQRAGIRAPSHPLYSPELFD